jgi:hypothetical protein
MVEGFAILKFPHGFKADGGGGRPCMRKSRCCGSHYFGDESHFFSSRLSGDIFRFKFDCPWAINANALMTFRKQNKDPETRWLKKARLELLDAGVPEFILDAVRRWNYLLLHGYDIESRWDPSWISKERAEKLLNLLRTQYPNSLSLSLLRDLERRIEDENSPR